MVDFEGDSIDQGRLGSKMVGEGQSKFGLRNLHWNRRHYTTNTNSYCTQLIAVMDQSLQLHVAVTCMTLGYCVVALSPVKLG